MVQVPGKKALFDLQIPLKLASIHDEAYSKSRPQTPRTRCIMTLRVVRIAAELPVSPAAPHRIDKASPEVVKSAQNAVSGQVAAALSSEAAVTQIRNSRPVSAKADKLAGFPEARELAKDVAEEIRERDGEGLPDIDPVVAKEHLVH